MDDVLDRIGQGDEEVGIELFPDGLDEGVHPFGRFWQGSVGCGRCVCASFSMHVQSDLRLDVSSVRRSAEKQTHSLQFLFELSSDDSVSDVDRSTESGES